MKMMRRAIALGFVVLEGCGLNVGMNPARRVFPNPPDVGALAKVPEYRAAAPPPSCSSDLGGVTVDRVDVEASSPWGADVESSGTAIYVPDPSLLGAMRERIAATVGRCPNRGPAGSHHRHLRFVIEHVEANVFADVGAGMKVARVTLRVEKYADEFSGVVTLRVDGALATPLAPTPVPELVLAALDRGLTEVFDQNRSWLLP